MSEADAIGATENDPSQIRLFKPIEMSEKFWEKIVYNYGSDEVFKAIANRHADDTSGVDFDDIQAYATDQLRHFKEIIDSDTYLSAGRKAQRIVEKKMLDQANTWFEDHPDAATVDVSAVYSAESDSHHDYRVGKVPGALFYTFDRSKLDDYYDIAFDIEDHLEIMESVVEGVTKLQHGEPINQQERGRITSSLNRGRNYWEKRIPIAGDKPEASRNIRFIDAMITKVGQPAGPVGPVRSA